MPGGVGMGEYWRFMGAAMLSMFLGAQSVHIFYRPLDDLDDYVMRAKEEKGKENQEGERPECSKATNVVLLPVHERNQVGLIRNAGINDRDKTLCCRDAVKAEQPGWKIGDISKEIARRLLFLYYKLCCKSLSRSSQAYLTEAHLIPV